MTKKLAVKAPTCPICGRPQDIGHMLLAHGPLAKGAKIGKRKRVRAVLPRLHRRLEEAGYDEVQAHNIIGLLADELRKAGLT